MNEESTGSAADLIEAIPAGMTVAIAATYVGADGAGETLEVRLIGERVP